MKPPSLVEVIKRDISKPGEEIKRSFRFIENKKAFTPLEVSNASGIGYAAAVRIIDILYELGYTN